MLMNACPVTEILSRRINTEARAQNARLYNSNDGKIIIPLRTEQDTPIPGFPNDMARLNEMKGS